MSTSQNLHLRFLGSPQVEFAGKRVSFATRKVMALLAYLAVTDQAHSRDTLAALLWPEVDQARARGSLRHALADLRKELGDEWLDMSGEILIWKVSGKCAVDVVNFHNLIEECRKHGHGEDEVCGNCVEPLTQAAALYRGEFLAGFSLGDSPHFEEWQFFQAESLRQMFTVVLQRLVQAHVHLGQLDLALPYARRWVHLEPLEEQVHCRLMQLYAQSGRQSAALRQYEICCQTLMDELGVEPAAETTELFRQIRKGQGDSNRARQAIVVPPSPRHNLPAATTPFIGRTHELADLDLLLRDPTVRLVTILGLGGMGKTRLALAAAARYLETSQEPVVFLALGPLLTVDHLVTALADTLGLALQSNERSPDEQLLDYLRPKQLLLVLDNFEHLLSGVGLVHAILQAAPNVHVLATSRERLQLSGEVIYALNGMSYQSRQSLDEAYAQETIQLFVQAARRLQPHFALTEQDLPALARICRQLGGMPLGILLAAARIDLLTPNEIADEIDGSLMILQTELRDVPERQRSITAMFEQSWQQLGETERNVLMRLALFRGGFTRAAAQSVASASLPALSILSNKSFIQREANGRYTMHELLRHFAANKLVAASAVEKVRGEYSRFYITFLAQREPDLKGPRQRVAFAEIEAEFDNIRQVWQWLNDSVLSAHLAHAMESLAIVYEWHGRIREAVETFAHIVEQLNKSQADQLLLAMALVWQAHFERVLGHYAQAGQLLQQSLVLIESPALMTLDTRRERATILKDLARLANDAANRQQASSLYEQSLRILRELGERWYQAKVLLDMEGLQRNFHGLGSAEEHQHQAEGAKNLVFESLAIFRELGDDANVAASLLALGVTLLTLGQPVEARPVFEEALMLCQELGVRSETFAEVIGYLGVAKEFLGEYAQVQEHGQLLLALAHETGYWQAQRLGYYLSGVAALAQKEHLVAEKWLAQCVTLSRLRKRNVTLAFNLSGWALATYWSGNERDAQQQLLESLQIVLDVGSIRPVVHDLLLAALLLADRNEVERAVELYALAYTFPFVANSRWCHDVAGWKLAAIAETLPTPVVTTAQQRGRTRDVWQAAQETLIWLGEGSVYV